MGSSRPSSCMRPRSSLGVQVLSQRATSPQSHFSAYASRHDTKWYLSYEHVEEQLGRTSPGPGIYNIPGAFLTPQLETSKQNMPRFSFPHKERWEASRATTPIGPGIYDVGSSFGRLHSSPSASFGQSTRTQAARLYSPPRLEHLKGLSGADSPPHTCPAAMGPQTLSQRPTAPAWSLRRPGKLKEEYEALCRSLPPPTKHSAWASLGKQPLPSFRAGRTVHAAVEHSQHRPGCGLRPKGYSPTQQVGSRQQAGASFTPQLLLPHFKRTTTPGPGAYD